MPHCGCKGRDFWGLNGWREFLEEMAFERSQNHWPLPFPRQFGAYLYLGMGSGTVFWRRFSRICHFKRQLPLMAEGWATPGGKGKGIVAGHGGMEISRPLEET